MTDAGPNSTMRSAELMSAIEEAYTTRFPQFLRVASAIVGDAERGRDAVQDAFARAISRRLDFRGDGPLEAWLWRTVTNVARDHRRTASMTVLSAEPPEPRFGVTSMPMLDAADPTMRERVARLPERQRLVLFLRYYVDLSYTEIGEALEIRTGTVSATLNAAHNALRRGLGPELGSPALSAPVPPLAVAA
jgi:RNA polymerase sigma-70 factor (ECF subfamily)